MFAGHKYSNQAESARNLTQESVFGWMRDAKQNLMPGKMSETEKLGRRTDEIDRGDMGSQLNPADLLASSNISNEPSLTSYFE